MLVCFLLEIGMGIRLVGYFSSMTFEGVAGGMNKRGCYLPPPPLLFKLQSVDKFDIVRFF